MTGMLGHPVAENPIDRMFDAVYAHHGLHWQFWKNDIADERDLALAVAALRPLGYRGMCVTVPWKVAVMPLLDELDDDVRAIGAANYMTIREGRLVGHNNDGKGVVKAIAKVAPLAGQRWSSPVRLPPGTTMLMNATHLGCAPGLEPVPVDWSTVAPGCLAVDVITNPRITPFLQAARERGCPVVDGVEMLVQLAMQIFEEWTGVRPEEAVFQRAVAAALGEG